LQRTARPRVGQCLKVDGGGADGQRLEWVFFKDLRGVGLLLLRASIDASVPRFPLSVPAKRLPILDENQR